jgi:hypothetical protein
MANTTRGQISLEGVDGKSYLWQITMNDMARIEADLAVKKDKPISFHEFLGAMQTWTAEDYRLFLWAGLGRTMPDASIEEVGCMFDLASFYKFQQDLARYLQHLLPEEAKKKAAAALMKN